MQLEQAIREKETLRAEAAAEADKLRKLAAAEASRAEKAEEENSVLRRRVRGAEGEERGGE